jgi:hypothetical protein
MQLKGLLLMRSFGLLVDLRLSAGMRGLRDRHRPPQLPLSDVLVQNALH